MKTVLPLDHKSGWKKESVVKMLEERGYVPENFFEWMRGQTIGIADNGDKIYYSHDVLRYLDRGRKANPLDS